MFPLVLLILSSIDLSLANVNGFQLGLQICDNGLGKNIGSIEYSGWSHLGGGWSGWATDDNGGGLDCGRIGLFNADNPSLTTSYIQDIDIRLAIQAMDGNNAGAIRYTPWLSEGGGWSLFTARSRDDVRVKIETRNVSGLLINDIQVVMKNRYIIKYIIYIFFIIYINNTGCIAMGQK